MHGDNGVRMFLLGRRDRAILQELKAKFKIPIVVPTASTLPLEQLDVEHKP